MVGVSRGLLFERGRGVAVVEVDGGRGATGVARAGVDGGRERGEDQEDDEGGHDQQQESEAEHAGAVLFEPANKDQVGPVDAVLGELLDGVGVPFQGVLRHGDPLRGTDQEILASRSAFFGRELFGERVIGLGSRRVRIRHFFPKNREIKTTVAFLPPFFHFKIKINEK